MKRFRERSPKQLGGKIRTSENKIRADLHISSNIDSVLIIDLRPC